MIKRKDGKNDQVSEEEEAVVVAEEEGEGEETKEEGNKVVIAVKDTGTGIDPELMPRLFTKFATKSYQGTGLGLYISKSIVEAHGGKMWAENNNSSNNNGSNNRKHQGATFYFTMPVVDMSLSI
jgi:signal transduction histidine kinase